MLSNIDFQLKKGTLKWWNRGVAARVVVAIDRWQLRQSAPARPFISERQAKAYRDLETAARNTARLRGDS